MFVVVALAFVVVALATQCL